MKTLHSLILLLITISLQAQSITFGPSSTLFNLDEAHWLKQNYPGVSGTGSDFYINSTKYTWHHLEDGKTLVPVLQSVHSKWKHTGGWSVIQKGLIGFFE